MKNSLLRLLAKITKQVVAGEKTAAIFEL